MADIRKIKILICDDSLLMRKKLKEALERIGEFEIFEAKDGQSAVYIAKLNNPDLVFMDIVMPIKDGIEAVKEIKAYNNDIKVIMASSSGTQTHLRKAIEAGASDFIQKPWDEAHISSIIYTIMRERE